MTQLPPATMSSGRFRGPARWLLLLLVALSAGACQKSRNTAGTTAQQSTYYTCSMHPQVHADGPGQCPICHMDLIAVQAAAAPAAVYTCPMHAQVHEAQPGLCPICGMDLVKKAAPVRPAQPGATPSAAQADTDLQLTPQQVELGNIHTQAMGASGAAAPPQTVLTGTITADAQQTESVSSRVAGRVEHLYVRQTGQLLRRGAPLFSVYSEQLQTLQQEYLLALTQSRELGGEYQQFALATAHKLRLLGLSAGQLRQLEARGRATPVVTYYSPQTGTVQTLDLVQGQYVAEGSPLLTLINLGSVWVEAQLYPAEASQLRTGQSVAVQVAGESAARRGKVVFLSPELQGSSQVLLARIQLPNAGGRLRPGMQANVLLAAPATPSHATLLVPTEAVIHAGSTSYVWKLTGPRQFRRVRVSTGEGAAETVPITAGVAPGDQIVVSGAYLLESEFTLRQGASNDHMSGMTM